MSRALRTIILLCLFGGIGLIGLFLTLRPAPPKPIPYKTTSVNFQEPGKVCPGGLDFDPHTGDLLFCMSTGGAKTDSDTSPVEMLNDAETDQIETLAQKLAAERGSLDKPAQSSVVALAEQLDDQHRAAYERSGGRMTVPKGQAPPSLLWIAGLVLIATAIGTAYLPARSRRG